MQALRSWRGEAVAWVLLCMALWPVPLLNRLHIESAAVLAAAAFLIAGWRAIGMFERRASRPVAAIRDRLLWLALPAALMTVPVLWAPNCDYARGFGYFLLFVPFSAGFGVGVAWLLTAITDSPRRWLIVVGLGVGLGGVIHDLGFHPQFYTYNHVFGGILGPIYDEDPVWRWGLVWFRALTVAWTVILVAAGSWRRGVRTWLLPAAALVIGVLYLSADRTGIVTTARTLERALPASTPAGRVLVHYDPAHLEPWEVRALVDAHAFHVDRIERRLGIRGQETIHSYIYPDADTRGRLTGARRTSVAPVWLPRAQIHLERASALAVVDHELAHAIARPLGLPLINASWSVGTVEGLAVAMEVPGGGPGPADLVASRWIPERADVLEQALRASLSPWGFWTGRGGVSYTVHGAYLSFLEAAEGAAAVRAAYGAWRPEDLNAKAWTDHLGQLPALAVGSGYRAALRLDVPSLAEQRCPHHVPEWVRAANASVDAPPLEAMADAERSMAGAPNQPLARYAWARAMAAASPGVARDSLERWDGSLVAFSLLLADIEVALGDSAAAFDRLGEVRRDLPVYARRSRARVTARRLEAGRADRARERLIRPDSLSGWLAVVDGLGSPQERAGRLSALPEASSLLDGTEAEEWAAFLAGARAEAAYGCRDLTAAIALSEEAARRWARLGDFPGAAYHHSRTRFFGAVTQPAGAAASCTISYP